MGVVLIIVVVLIGVGLASMFGYTRTGGEFYGVIRNRWELFKASFRGR